MFLRYTYVNLNAVRYAVTLLQMKGEKVRSDVLGFLAAHMHDDSNCMLQIGPYSIAVSPEEPQVTE